MHPFRFAAGPVGGWGGARGQTASRFQIALKKCFSRLVLLLIRRVSREFLHPELRQTASRLGAGRLPIFVMCRALLGPKLND